MREKRGTLFLLASDSGSDAYDVNIPRKTLGFNLCPI